MQNSLAVQIPRDLIDPQIQDLPVGNTEGLVSVLLTWYQEKITDIKPFKMSNRTSLPLALSPFIEPHTHIDKAFSSKVQLNANTIGSSLRINAIEHTFRTTCTLEERINYSLHLAWKQGIRAIRTHIDTQTPTGQISWEILQDLRLQWANHIALQLVALAPLPFWSTVQGYHLARQVAKSGGLLGGIVGPPSPKNLQNTEDIIHFLHLAELLDCSVDLHIDESASDPGIGVRLVTQIMEIHKIDTSITYSHASSMGLLSARDSRELSDRIAAVNCQVIALPWTNFWLLGHKKQTQTTPVVRPIAPIHQLQGAGVNVAIGSDNIQDAWFPIGDFDITKLITFSSIVTHLTPWSRQGLSLFTTAPSRILGLEWDGVFRIGAPADILLFDCQTWQSLLSNCPRRNILRRGRWIP